MYIVRIQSRYISENVVNYQRHLAGSIHIATYSVTRIPCTTFELHVYRQNFNLYISERLVSRGREYTVI